MSLSYELCKQLRDAGFPQTTNLAFVKSPHARDDFRTVQSIAVNEDNDGRANLLSAGYEVVSLPSLEELIDACGEECLVVKQYLMGDWCASNEYEPHPFHEQCSECDNTKIAEPRDWKRCEGKTPIEAVAKLYLQLNKKKDS